MSTLIELKNVYKEYQTGNQILKAAKTNLRIEKNHITK